MAATLSLLDIKSYYYTVRSEIQLGKHNHTMSYALVSDSSDRGSGQGRILGNNGTTTTTTTENDTASASSSRKSSSDARTSLSEPLALNGDVETGENAADPFYVFRADMYRKLQEVDEALAEFLRIVHQTDTSVNSHELKDAKKQLKRHLKSAESTLKDVQMTVQLVESDREKFAHIDDTELYERTSLVRTSQDRLGRARSDITSVEVKAKLMADERAKAIRRAGATSLGARNDAERDNTSFIVDSQARTSLLLQEQDDTLDELEGAVVRVGHMAEGIHDELGQQNKMLTDMEEDLTNVEEELGLVMGKLAKFLKTKDTWQLGTILTLFVTMIVLLFLVIYV